MITIWQAIVKLVHTPPVHTVRKKIAYIIAHQQGIEDPQLQINFRMILMPPSFQDRDCPGVVEETKYWVTTERPRRTLWTLGGDQDSKVVVDLYNTPTYHSLPNHPLKEA